MNWCKKIFQKGAPSTRTDKPQPPTALIDFQCLTPFLQKETLFLNSFVSLPLQDPTPEGDFATFKVYFQVFRMLKLS